MKLRLPRFSNRMFQIAFFLALICQIHQTKAASIILPDWTDPVTKEVKRDVNGKRTYETKRITGEPPDVDGVMDDEAWDLVEWSGDFTQWMPDEGAEPFQNTQFKILYDDKNLYVGIRAHDTEPEKIVQRMGRRDEFDGDWVEINIDSYNDKRTAFSFTASASGVKGDEFISNNGNNWDSKWDPIWYLKTSTDGEGWTAEFKIPLSQLRFSAKETQVWGIQIQRRFFREGSRSLWQFISREESGWVSHFGELTGIQGIKPQKQLEIQPYVVASAETYEKEEGNPFRDGQDESLNFGIDGKVGITNDVTLDFTVNPDFGQVEADPSQLNLSAFQLFFQERRPFFIEGNNILNFSITQFRNDNLFYSRRIGRRPQGYPDLADGAYTNVPNNTRILGAAKITGKNKNGFSFSVLESVTARENAEIDLNGQRTEEQVEPLTNYFVARAQQDLNEGNTVVGGMVTSMSRDIGNSTNLQFLHKQAWSGGVDLLHQWKEQNWFLSFNSVFSNVQGSAESILESQTASERFYQRPDNTYRSVDPSRTSLSGSGGQFKIGKQGGRLNYEIGTAWLSPGLEINDVGFLRNTDNITQWVFTGYKWIKPFSIFRSARVNLIQFLTWDYGGVNTDRGLELFGGGQFKNFWGFNFGLNLNGDNISNADLRGGPSIKYPGSTNIWYWFGTDQRKKLVFMFNNWFNWGGKGYRYNTGYWSRIRYQPLDALSVSLSPSVSWTRNDQQYVTTADFSGVERYVTASIDQVTYRMEIRLNYNLNPNLSIQYWGQPFITNGEYTSFNRITNSVADRYEDRFHTFQANEITYSSANGLYDVDEDGDSVVDYSIEDPNFNFLQFRSNMVLRWEYVPGSTLFLVWTQSMTDFPPFSADDRGLRSFTDDLLSVKPNNIFLIKYTYRFIL